MEKTISPHVPRPGCPLCFANGKLEVVAHYPPDAPLAMAAAYLVLAKGSPNGDDYLVIPADHLESEDDLPDDFTAACKYLRRFIPWIKEVTADPKNRNAASYHVGTNYGASSGQTLQHVHQWYVRTPAGYLVFGIATYAHLEVMCENSQGMGLAEFLDSNTVWEAQNE